jgi:biotin operon repressor
MPPNKHTLLSLLQSHIGQSKGISVRDIAYHLRTSERQVRLAVTELRMDGIAVCGHPTTGYYIAETPEELERTCAFLRSRALQSLTLEANLRRVPLPDLIGQLHLRT